MWPQVLAWILSTLAAAAVAFVGFLVLLPTRIGESYLNFRFARQLEEFKNRQTEQIEQLKERLNHLGDRGKRSNEMEFAAIRLVWEKFVEAFLATNTCITQMIHIPDFESMSSAEFASFLSSAELTEAQSNQLSTATDRKTVYADIVHWNAIMRARRENFEALLALRKQGIFMPESLKKEFRDFYDLLSAAQVEEHVTHQHKNSTIGYTARSKLLGGGEATLEKLAVSANRRLFRDEVAVSAPPSASGQEVK